MMSAAAAAGMRAAGYNSATAVAAAAAVAACPEGIEPECGGEPSADQRPWTYGRGRSNTSLRPLARREASRAAAATHPARHGARRWVASMARATPTKATFFTHQRLTKSITVV